MVTHRLFHAHHSSRRAGATLLEVSVVIAILAILLALLLMSVQRTRSTARKLSCTANLHQIGIAVNNYVELHGQFPSVDTGNWATQLLPALGYSTTLSEWKQIMAGELAFEDLTPVPIYYCPDDPEAVSMRIHPSYNMCDGANAMQCRCFNGVFRGGSRNRSGGIDYRPVRPRDISDGMSQTAAMSERLVCRVQPGLASDYPQLWIQLVRDTPLQYMSPSDYDAFSEDCEHRALPPGPKWHLRIESCINGVGPFYNHVMPPNHNSCSAVSPDGDYSAYTTSSRHTGGVNVLLLDGSVHFASENVDRSVWRALGTRNGNESVSLPF